MKVTIRYMCSSCKTAFPAYCGVPDHMENHTVGHKCPGVSAFAGIDGVFASYMCCKCGHTTRTDVTTMIPAMSSRVHGCGLECVPA